MKFKYLIILIAIFVITIIPNYIVRDYTPKNELKYLYLTQELEASNNLFVLTEDGELYTDKPPFYFWLLHLTRKISISNNTVIMGIWAWGAALILLIIQFYYSIKYTDKYSAFLGCLFLLTTACSIVCTLNIRMDMLQTLFIFLALLEFYKIYIKKKEKPWLIWVYMGLAVWIKGPAGILIPGGVILSFLLVEKNKYILKKIKPLKGVGILIAFIIVWLIPAYFEGGKEYINAILFKQTLGRGFNAFIHKEPFYYYLKTSIIYFAPWVLFYFSAIVYTLFNFKQSSTFQRFLVIWIVSTFLIFSLLSSKISIYLLPIYPAMAMLISTYLSKDIRYKNLLVKGFLILLLFAVIVGSVFMPSNINGIDFSFNKWSLFAIGTILLILTAVFLKRTKVLYLVMLAFPIVLLVQGSLVFGKVNSIIGMGELNGVINRELIDFNDCNVVSYKYQEGKYLKAYSNIVVKCIDRKEKLERMINEGRMYLIFTKDKYKKHLTELGGIVIYSNSRYTLVKYGDGEI
jgi:4-amino-4-deoxy-L-arabinose transferase-like glycosyltransferase